MKHFFKTVFEKAKLFFIDEKQLKLQEKTKQSHEISSEIMSRSINELSSNFTFKKAYTLFYETDPSSKKELYSFTEAYNIFDLQQAFIEGKGTLILVDEESKRKINEQFKYFRGNVSFLNEVITQTPDFLYQINDEEYWLNLEPIRNEEEEEMHTEYLEILYHALYQTKEIKIDACLFEKNDFFVERDYHLNFYRLTRNSLFLAVSWEGQVYSHNFQYITQIKMLDLRDRLKFWLYTPKGSWRFYIPYNSQTLFEQTVPIDPILDKDYQNI
ncbi:hypothetical protein [Bacillus cereus]